MPIIGVVYNLCQFFLEPDVDTICKGGVVMDGFMSGPATLEGPLNIYLSEERKQDYLLLTAILTLARTSRLLMGVMQRNMPLALDTAATIAGNNPQAYYIEWSDVGMELGDGLGYVFPYLRVPVIVLRGRYRIVTTRLFVGKESLCKVMSSESVELVWEKIGWKKKKEK